MEHNKHNPDNYLDSWLNFKIPSGSTSRDLKKEIANNMVDLNRESKIFSAASIYNGGTKTNKLD